MAANRVNISNHDAEVACRHLFWRRYKEGYDQGGHPTEQSKDEKG